MSKAFRVCAPCNDFRECTDDECSCGICMGVVNIVTPTPWQRITCFFLGHRVDPQLGGIIYCERCGKTVDRDWYPMGFNYRSDEDGEYVMGSMLGRFERDLKEGKARMPDPLDNASVTHLHYRHMKGKFIWVLSTTRNSVCRTQRCVPVDISPEGEGHGDCFLSEMVHDPDFGKIPLNDDGSIASLQVYAKEVWNG